MRFLASFLCFCSTVFACIVLVYSPGLKKPFLPLLDELLSLLESGGAADRVHRLSHAIASATHGGPVEVLELAHLGGGNNFERNLHRWAKKKQFSRFLPEPYKFKLKKKGFDELQDHYCILPHELFASLYSAGASELFDHLFTGGEQNLLDWWRDAGEVGDSWIRQHPVVHNTPDPARRIPFGIHGDDAGMRGSESILVVTWGSVAIRGATLDTRLLFSMLKLREVEKDVTMDQFYEVLRWSLTALSTGRFPEADHLNRPFTHKALKQIIR